MNIRTGIAGSRGRMGKAIISAVLASDDLSLAGGTEPNANGETISDPATGTDTGKPVMQHMADLAEISDVLIDFTVLGALEAHLQVAVSSKIPLVIGTTGLAADHHRMINDAARQIPVVQSGNMSLGVNVLEILVEKAARILGDDWDAEIVEMHHRHKVDAPSGTALMLGEAIARGRGRELQTIAGKARDGQTGVRKQGDVGFASLRGGGVIGDHSVILAGESERIELTHRAGDRSLFAAGAVQAARWIVSQPPGRYDMKDVIGSL